MSHLNAFYNDVHHRRSAAILNRQAKGDDEDEVPNKKAADPTTTTTRRVVRPTDTDEDDTTTTTRRPATTETTTTARTTATVETTKRVPATSSPTRSTTSSSRSLPTSSSSSSSSSVLRTSSSTQLIETQFKTVTQALPSSSSAAQASSTAEVTNTGGMSTGSILGVVAGTILGIAAVCVVIGFFVRRIRRRREDREHFDAADFRKSAVLIDDPSPFPTTRPTGYGATHAGGPPSMIERNMAHTPIPAHPASSYAPSQYSQSIYGQYANYGQPQAQHPSLTPGEYMSATPSQVAVNPFNANASSQYVQMERASSVSPATPTAAVSEFPPLANPHERAAAVPAVPAKDTVKPDAPATDSTKSRRPTSVYSTIYNPDDAYGGM